MSQQYVVRICPDCKAERRLEAWSLCNGEGRVAITPFPQWMNDAYPYNFYPDSVPTRVEEDVAN
jgi:hypothetical protein